MVRVIFMIDDDQDDREIFRDALNLVSPLIEVSFAGDGVEALYLLRSKRIKPDVIFLDYNMPRMNGVECLKELKTSADTKHIPVVMYTTSGSRQDENLVLSLGANYYMRKTVSFTQLCHELNRLLESISESKHLSGEEQRDGNTNLYL